METVIYLILTIILFIAVYLIYQLIRNEIVYKIRMKWIKTEDNRYSLYSYDFMQDPNKHNYFGLKFPKECNYVNN